MQKLCIFRMGNIRLRGKMTGFFKYFQYLSHGNDFDILFASEEFGPINVGRGTDISDNRGCTDWMVSFT